MVVFWFVFEIILGILFVVVVGFGVLLGVLVLVLYFMGMVVKFYVEVIEYVDLKFLEVVKVVGVSWF